MHDRPLDNSLGFRLYVSKECTKRKRGIHFKNQTGKTQFQSALEEDQQDTGLLSVSEIQQRLQKNIEKHKRMIANLTEEINALRSSSGAPLAQPDLIGFITET